MRLFPRKKRGSLSEFQGVPDGAFRCDVCKFVQPVVCLCGAVLDAADDHPTSYTLCGVCAMWLGFGELHFPQGLCFNFSEEQREKIRALQKELDIADKELKDGGRTSREELLAGAAERGLIGIHDFLDRVPNLRELCLLRFSLLPQNIIDLSSRLTRGEFVDPSEIRLCQR